MWLAGETLVYFLAYLLTSILYLYSKIIFVTHVHYFIHCLHKYKVLNRKEDIHGTNYKQ